MKNCILILALLSAGCGNQSRSRCDSAILVPIESFRREIADPALWRELLPTTVEALMPETIRSFRFDPFGLVASGQSLSLDKTS